MHLSWEPLSGTVKLHTQMDSVTLSILGVYFEMKNYKKNTRNLC